jgi:hypothetical protein
MSINGVDSHAGRLTFGNCSISASSTDLEAEFDSNVTLVR